MSRRLPQALLAALLAWAVAVPVAAQSERLGPRVLEFSRQRSVRGRAQPKLAVVVYTDSALTPAQQTVLEELGVDPRLAGRGGAPIEATPGVLRALGRLDWVVHVDDRVLVKLDTVLARAAVASARSGGRGPASIAVEVVLRPGLTPEQRQQLAGFGFDPRAIVRDRVVGRVELHQLEALAALDWVVSIAQPEAADLLQALAPVRAFASSPSLERLHRRGLTGRGVKVAVIDSDFAPDDPRLRGGVVHVESLPTGLVGDRGHGTAVAATLRAVAPEAQLILLSVGSTPGVSVYRAIDRALELGASVINLSLGKAIPEEGFLRGGSPLARELNDKLVARKAVLVAAAGNYNRSLYYLSDAATGMAEGSALRLGLQDAMAFTWPRALKETYVFVAWDDAYLPEQQRTSDLTLELWDVAKRQLLAVSDDNQLASKPPREVLRLARPGSPTYGRPGFVSVGNSERFELRVRSNLPERTLRGRALRLGAGVGVRFGLPSNRTSISAAPYALAEASIMVGAYTPVPGGYRVEPHSGRGPQQDGTPRPDVLAPAVTLFGGRAFQGTSVATPYVTGLCALLKGSRPDLGPAEIKALLARQNTQPELRDPVSAVEASLDRIGR